MSRLEWFVYLERKDVRDWVSARRNLAIAGNVGKGRPKKRWNEVEVVTDDLKKCGLVRCLARDRERWKAQDMEKTFDLCEHGQET